MLGTKRKKKVEEKIKGTFTQYPIRLAWAITVHKSQGLTFEKVIADLGAAFEDGQVYVALSRCTTSTGLHLKTKIPRGAIKANLKAIDFAKNETPGTLITQQLSEGKADFYYKKSREAIKGNDFHSALDSFTNALKFRNDIDTEIFRRYFLATFSRLNSYKYLSSKLSSELAVVNKINFELQECQGRQEQKILEQNNAIKLLLDKTKELERTNDKSDQQISTLRKELKLISDNLTSLQTTADKQATKIREQENTIRTQEKEIERLRNLKWHQKLFGEK